jgi:hypothetical protein
MAGRESRETPMDRIRKLETVLETVKKLVMAARLPTEEGERRACEAMRELVDVVFDLGLMGEPSEERSGGAALSWM